MMEDDGTGRDNIHILADQRAGLASWRYVPICPWPEAAAPVCISFNSKAMTASDRPWMGSVVASAGPATVSVQRQLSIPSA